MPSSYTEDLFEEEIFWRDRYDFFRARGYTFRRRYHPDWQPSWKSIPDAIPIFFEDGLFQWKGALLDAQTENGQDVFIKRVDRRTHPHELEIAHFLGCPKRQAEENNHCVPVLDVVDDDDSNYRYIVMPLLRPFYEPNFTTVGEVVQFVKQTLEGLAHMHAHNIAHRDCAAENILMDAADLYKNGWHPMNSELTRNGRPLSSPSRSRSEVEIKYYFIDFGLSTRFSSEQRDRLVLGELGRVQAPEQLTGIPYDPFKYDIYVLGTVYKTKIVDVFRGLEPLGGLAQLMMKPDPKDRPTAEETKTLWESLKQVLPPRWARLRTTEEESHLTHLVNNTLDVVGMVRDTVGL